MSRRSEALRRRTRTAATAVILVASLAAAASAAVSTRAVGPLRVGVAEDVRVDEQAGLPDDVALVTCARSGERVLLTVYAGAEPPAPERALERHGEALRARFARPEEVELTEAQRRLMGATSPARRVEAPADAARVELVAARTKGHTVVALWYRPAELADEASFGAELLASLRLAAD